MPEFSRPPAGYRVHAEIEVHSCTTRTDKNKGDATPKHMAALPEHVHRVKHGE